MPATLADRHPIAAGALFSVSDAEGDPITAYELTATAGSFRLAGVLLPAGTVSITGSQLADLIYYAPASPGTVGAMNNVGVNQGLGEKPGSEKNINQGSGVGTSSKNLAGGQQPASPGTIGALNNAGADQKLGNQGNKGDDC